jgi:hypothetical protein
MESAAGGKAVRPFTSKNEEGRPKNKRQPDFIGGVGKNPGRATGQAGPRVIEGAARNKAQPRLGSIPGSETPVTGRRNGKNGRGKGSMNKGSGRMMPAGVPKGYGP